MVRKRITALGCFALLASLGAAGQESVPAANTVFAPFVSQLKGEVRNRLVRLSWVDSVDVKGPLYIYRSLTPIDAASAGSMHILAEVPYGIQAYIDDPGGAGVFYYYVSAGDTSGQRYNVFIPFTNSISVEITPEILEASVDPELANSPQTIVHDPSTEAQTSSETLPPLLIAVPLPRTQPAPQPEPPPAPQPEPPPLPKLSPEALRAVKDIIDRNAAQGRRLPPERLKTPRAFSEDMNTAVAVGEYSVRAIVQRYFLRRNWQTARDELRRLLNAPLDAAEQARARYYLGQSLFFCGSYQESLYEFFSIQIQYPEEAREWIAAALKGMGKRY
ncbi:MAG: hypothetical protein LBR16_04070 [Treponema sp.]|nr:hypothetical protein [Treponema sp.]